MQKILLLTRFVKEYEPKRIAEEARKGRMEVKMMKYGQITLVVNQGIFKAQFSTPTAMQLGGQASNKRIEEYDYVIPRAASKRGSSMVGVKAVLMQEASRLKISTLNGESFAKYPLLGKIEQGAMLAVAGLPTVDFVSFGSRQGWREFKKNPVFSFPLIVKGRFGSHGRTVKLVNHWEQFERVFGEYKEGSVLIQPKLRVRQWYRCLVLGGKYLGEMRHRQKDKYGGEGGKLVKFSEKKMRRLREICLRAAELFSCDFAGLDVVWDENRQSWVILEVNRTAQFKYFERRTGVNVAGEIVEFMRKKKTA